MISLPEDVTCTERIIAPNVACDQPAAIPIPAIMATVIAAAPATIVPAPIAIAVAIPVAITIAVTIAIPVAIAVPIVTAPTLRAGAGADAKRRGGEAGGGKHNGDFHDYSSLSPLHWAMKRDTPLFGHGC